MARVNVEDGALPRINKLAGLMGVSDREAAGTVYMLWRDSQDVLACTGDREDMVDWAHLYGMDDTQVDRWLHALERSRFISREGEIWRIHGNDVQIESRVSRLHKATKGAKATKDKWDRIKQAGLEPTPSTLPSVPHEAQSKPIQTSAIQTSASQCSGEPPLPPQLCEHRLLRVLAAREFTRKNLEHFFGLYPDPDWLRDELLKWDAEADSSPQFAHLPVITRFRTFADKHWQKRKNAARAGPRDEIDMVDFITKRDAAAATGGGK